MIDIGLPKWTKNRDGYFLMKFFNDESYLQDFIDGKIYFNTSDFFARCEEEGRGDPDEGNDFIVSKENANNVSVNVEVVNGKVMIVARDFSNEPENFIESTVFSYSSGRNRGRKVVSFYTAFCNVEKKTVDMPVDAEMDAFGEYGLMIFDRAEFFDRVCNKIQKLPQVQEAQLGFVKYAESSVIKGLVEWNPFLKRESYSKQNEFRITYVDADKEPYKLDVGDLSDIVFPILKKDLKEIFLDNEGIHYPIYKK